MSEYHSLSSKAKKVMIDKENTTIVTGAGKKTDIEARVSQIKAEIQKTTSGYVRSSRSVWPSSRAASQ